MAKQIGDRWYLEPGDLVTVNDGDLEYTGNGHYKLSDLSDATLRFWVEADEKGYKIRYAMDLPQSDANYSNPYFEKE